MGSYIIRESQGEIANFDYSESNLPVADYKFSFAPKTGYIAGKNKYPIYINEDNFEYQGGITVTGGTITPDNEGKYITATATGVSKLTINIGNETEIFSTISNMEAGSKTISFSFKNLVLVAGSNNITIKIIIGTSSRSIQLNRDLDWHRVSFTTTETNPIQFYMSIGAYQNNASCVLKDLQIEYGTEATEYEPYSLNVPTFYGWTDLNLYHTGTNLWDENWEAGDIDENGNDIVDDTKFRSVGYMPIKGGQSYTYRTVKKIFFYWYTKDKLFISSNSPEPRNPFIAPDTAYYFRIACKNSDTYNNDISLNYPDTETEYNAHVIPETKLISWLDLGVIYGGYVTSNSIIKTWSNSMPLSDLTWYDTVIQGHDGFFATVPDGKKDISFSAICTTYTYDSNLSQDKTFFVGYNISFNAFIIIRDDRYSDAEDFANNTTEQATYILETSIRYDKTFPVLSTFVGANNYWTDANDTEIYYYITKSSASQKYLIQTDTIISIADKIRNKTCTTAPIEIGKFSDMILKLEVALPEAEEESF